MCGRGTGKLAACPTHRYHAQCRQGADWLASNGLEKSTELSDVVPFRLLGCLLLECPFFCNARVYLMS